jgi:PKD repeat protein
MFTFPHVRRLLPLAFASFALIVAGTYVFSASANADNFGELASFSLKGHVTERGTKAVAFGVDPTDNSFYVGDEPEEHTFRVQKFDAEGHLVGSASFTFEGKGPEHEATIEGIAVDPVEKRIYVLGTQERGAEEQAVYDPEVQSAGSLYAFSTVPTAGKLEAAPGTKTTEGLLVSSATLHAQSKELGKNSALLEPGGIAVDPTTHDVIIMGNEDLGKAEEPLLHVALERVGKEGKVGARYVDNTEFFGAPNEAEATSPVVTPAGKVFVVGGSLGPLASEQIDEIPTSFSSSELPKPLVEFDSGPKSLVIFPGNPVPAYGAGMSLGPEGSFYVDANLGGAGERNPAVLEFNASGAEVGWTGGQSKAVGLGHCTISFLGHPTVAAGKEGRVFVFDSNPEAPNVLEFGPGGSGCPAAKSTPLAASPETGLHAGTEVKLSSTLTAANALSVKWSFGDGKPEVETTNQYLAPEVTHKFSTEGAFKVKETIHTDNLATPVLIEERTVNVNQTLPVAEFSFEDKKANEAISFNAEGSSDANVAAHITKYVWEFGDGTSPQETASAIEPHTYSAAATYVVKLTVIDSIGLTSIPVSHEVKVGQEQTTTTTNTTSTGTGTGTGTGSTPPSSPPPPGQGGVLGYSLSVPGTSLSVSKAGAVVLKIDCAGPSNCAGGITLRSLAAVGAGRHKAILVLATGSFTLAGGQVKTLTLHLSAKARALLAKSHVLRVRATVLAHDSQGAMHSTQAVLTLRAHR